MGKAQLKDKKIVIDAENDLVFASEDELFDHFSEAVTGLEEKFFKWRKDSDLSVDKFRSLENRLDKTLENPDEIWRDHPGLANDPVTVYVKVFEAKSGKEEDLEYYVAVTYLTDDVPSFIYLHFPSNDMDLIERFREGDLVFSKALGDLPPGAIEGDALCEGDELATGLYEAMLVVRASDDVSEDNFREYSEYREIAVEEADEIWRRDDSMGNILVTFIRDFTDDEGEELFYVVVTVEDEPSSSHALLFSFPTTDKSLLERYRIGENLQAEEVIQEISH